MTLEFRWTKSRARDTYGYNICSLFVDGRKVSACNGGGYDMKGTALGDWIASAYADRLRALTKKQIPLARNGQRQLYGLAFYDPNYDPSKVVIDGETIEQREASGKSLGLERYQAFHGASSKIPSKRHTIPQIDGACGFSSVEEIMKAVGLTLQYVPTKSRDNSLYILTDTQRPSARVAS